jgi:hypothetical protein
MLDDRLCGACETVRCQACPSRNHIAEKPAHDERNEAAAGASAALRDDGGRRFRKIPPHRHASNRNVSIARPVK